MAKIAYPDRLSDISMNDEVKQFNKEVFSYELDDDQVNKILAGEYGSAISVGKGQANQTMSTVDLIVSRGSSFFWDNLDVAFHEINRVLSPDEKNSQELFKKNNPERIKTELQKNVSVHTN